MTLSAILVSVVIGLIVNECCDISPWLARKLVSWAAKRTYSDEMKAAIREEEWAAVIDERPGKLLKLATALAFVAGAVANSSRNAASRRFARALVMLGELIALSNRSSIAAKARTAAQAEMTSALITVGAPLVSALGHVADSRHFDQQNATLDRFRQLVVNAAQSQCGKSAGARSHMRSVYYELVNDRLVRTNYFGREGIEPRREFRRGDSPHDDELLAVAHGDTGVLVRDIDNYPPPHFQDHKNRTYKTLIAIPVRAGETPYGVLVVDSDVAHSLTEVDQAFMVVLAGLLATGLALQNRY